MSGDYIKCPYCGWVDNNTWECGMGDGDSDIVECGSCERKFRVECSVSRTFDCSKETDHDTRKT